MNRWLLLLMLGGLSCATSREKGIGPGAQLGPAGITEAGRPKRYAVVVGIDHYEDERFNPLKYAARDAEAVGAALEGFEKVTVLNRPERTTRAQILAALDQLAKDASDPTSTVVLYFSGHGSLAQQPGGALERVLVTHDARLDLLAETGLRIDELLAFVDRVPSKRKAVVLALCHSGRGKSQFSDPLNRALAGRKSAPVLPLEQRSEHTIVLTACAFGETARESDELCHDIYTAFLLQALVEGDRDGDGAITASEAHDWARERVYQFTAGSQRPTSESQLLGVDPIVFRGERQRLGRPVVYSYAPSAEGLSVVLDGRAKGTLPGGVGLEVGAHRLELRDGSSGRALFEGDVNLEAGQRLDVATLVPAPLRVTVAAQGASWLPLDAHTRADFAPAAWGAGLSVSLSGLGRRGWLELAFDWGRGASAAASFGTALPFTFDVFRGELAGGLGFFPHHSLELEVGGVLGGARLLREFKTDGYQSSEGAWGGSAALRGRARWNIVPWLSASVTADVGMLLASLGAQQLHGYSAFGIALGVRID